MRLLVAFSTTTLQMWFEQAGAHLAGLFDASHESELEPRGLTLETAAVDSLTLLDGTTPSSRG